MFPTLRRTPSEVTYSDTAKRDVEALLDRSTLLRDQAAALQDELESLRRAVTKKNVTLKNAQALNEIDREELLAITNAAEKTLMGVEIRVDVNAGLDDAQIASAQQLSDVLQDLEERIEAAAAAAMGMNSGPKENARSLSAYVHSLYNASLPEPTGPVDSRFQSLLLGCGSKAQKQARRRLQQLAAQVATLAEAHVATTQKEMSPAKSGSHNMEVECGSTERVGRVQPRDRRTEKSSLMGRQPARSKAMNRGGASEDEQEGAGMDDMDGSEPFDPSTGILLPSWVTLIARNVDDAGGLIRADDPTGRATLALLRNQLAAQGVPPATVRGILAYLIDRAQRQANLVASGVPHPSPLARPHVAEYDAHGQGRGRAVGAGDRGRAGTSRRSIDSASLW